MHCRIWQKDYVNVTKQDYQSKKKNANIKLKKFLKSQLYDRLSAYARDQSMHRKWLELISRKQKETAEPGTGNRKMGVRYLVVPEGQETSLDPVKRM